MHILCVWTSCEPTRYMYTNGFLGLAPLDMCTTYRRNTVVSKDLCALVVLTRQQLSCTPRCDTQTIWHARRQLEKTVLVVHIHVNTEKQNSAWSRSWRQYKSLSRYPISETLWNMFFSERQTKSIISHKSPWSRARTRRSRRRGSRPRRSSLPSSSSTSRCCSLPSSGASCLCGRASSCCSCSLPSSGTDALSGGLSLLCCCSLSGSGTCALSGSLLSRGGALPRIRWKVCIFECVGFSCEQTVAWAHLWEVKKHGKIRDTVTWKLWRIDQKFCKGVSIVLTITWRSKLRLVSRR